MKKLFKITIIVFLLLFCITMIVISFTFADPTRFKTIIENALIKQTKQPVKIDGALSWTLFPSPSLHAERVVVYHSAPLDKMIFAEIDGLVVRVKLLPLLHRQIEIDELSISALKLYLVKRQTNNRHEDLHQSMLPDHPVLPKPTFQWFDNMKISHLHIKNGTIIFRNEKWRLPVSGPMRLSSQVIIDNKKQSFSFNNMMFDVQPEKQPPIIITGNLWGDRHTVRGQLKLNHIEISHFKITDLSMPVQYNKGVIDFSSISGSCYQGVMQAHVHMDFNHTLPPIVIQATLKGVNVASLMQGMHAHHKLKFFRLADADIQINAMLDQRIKIISGNGSLNLHAPMDRPYLKSISIPMSITDHSPHLKIIVDEEQLMSMLAEYNLKKHLQKAEKKLRKLKTKLEVLLSHNA